MIAIAGARVIEEQIVRHGRRVRFGQSLRRRHHRGKARLRREFSQAARSVMGRPKPAGCAGSHAAISFTRAGSSFASAEARPVEHGSRRMSSKPILESCESRIAAGAVRVICQQFPLWPERRSVTGLSQTAGCGPPFLLWLFNLTCSTSKYVQSRLQAGAPAK